jgi:hypothetical protein
MVAEVVMLSCIREVPGWNFGRGSYILPGIFVVLQSASRKIMG